MGIFWEHLFKYTFLQYALLAGVLASFSCGIVGSFVVVRRTTYVAGAIAHCVLGGMGVATYLYKVKGIEWCTPLLGALVAAVFAALVISLVTASGKEREDTVLSAIWAVGMAVGISFISATPGYNEDLMSYLFGNILMVNEQSIWYMALLDVVVVGLTIMFYNKFLVIAFQPELARLRGIRVGFYHTMILIMTALTVVLLTQIVGLVMVIALLTLPAAASSKLCVRLWKMMLLSAFFCLVLIVTGVAVSYQPDLPSGATIIELAGLLYIVIFIYKRFKKRHKYERF